MENHHLLFIEDFSETVSNIFKNMAQIVRKHSENMKEERPELVQIRNELMREKRRRMELEDIVKQKFKGTTESAQNKPPEEKKRPLTAFALFLADHRDKILLQHPGLDLHKIATLASFKWKRLSREGQMVYEKKLEEINKISDEELMKAKKVIGGETCMVKREYDQEEESKKDDDGQGNPNENEPSQPQQDPPMQTENCANDNPASEQPQHQQSNPQPSSNDNPQQPLQGTQLMDPYADNQPTLQMPRSPSPQ